MFRKPSFSQVFGEFGRKSLPCRWRWHVHRRRGGQFLQTAQLRKKRRRRRRRGPLIRRPRPSPRSTSGFLVARCWRSPFFIQFPFLRSSAQPALRPPIRPMNYPTSYPTDQLSDQLSDRPIIRPAIRPASYPTKTNQIKSNQIKSNQIKSNPIKSNQTAAQGARRLLT